MPDLYSLIVTAIDCLKKHSGLVTVKTHTLYTRSLNEQSVVLDLGANVGEFAAAITAMTGATCHAVEAVTSVFDQIPTIHRVKRYNLAISDRDGPLRVFGSENRECNSVHRSIAESYGLRGVEMCAGITLQSFLYTHNIRQVGLLKVDIEGAEELLFDSTPDHILRNIHQITVEFHDFISGSINSDKVDRIRERLASLGFYCIPFSYLFTDMRNGDLLFIQRHACDAGSFDRVCFVVLKALLRLERAKSGIRSRMGRYLVRA